MPARRRGLLRQSLRGLAVKDKHAPVVLVVPPVLYPGVPTLGANLLAAECRAAGIAARVHHASVRYAARIGFDLCMRLAGGAPRKMLGEAIFLSSAFPERASEQDAVLETVAALDEPLQQYGRVPSVTVGELEWCARDARSFFQETVVELLSYSPGIVGISSMCQQLLASIALAREVKRQAPDVITVLGGANATEPMGTALLRLADVFDFIFSGEADIEFPAFCRDYVYSGRLPERRVIDCRPVGDLDRLPVPDYDDYFDAIAPYRTEPLMHRAPFWLIFESSRGCWWGEKRACTFCGFNAPGGNYRVKTAAKVVSEMEALAERYGVTALYASDNVMAPDFPRTVLPLATERGSSFTLFYEVKSGLREADLDALVRAGVVEVQPGIESLSTPILQLMSKGVTALENIRLLRNCRSRGLEVVWNVLTGIPGERREHYEAMIAAAPLFEHLRPPTRWGPLRISRYSPYHRDPAKHGITNIQPWDSIRLLYGDAASELSQHFTGEYESEFLKDIELVQRLHSTLWKWAAAWDCERPPWLEAERREDGGMLISDGRSGAKRSELLLSSELTRVLDRLSCPISGDRLPAGDRTAADALVQQDLALFYEGEYLSLVTEPAIARKLRVRKTAAELMCFQEQLV